MAVHLLSKSAASHMTSGFAVWCNENNRDVGETRACAVAVAGKGAADRYSILSATVLDMLRQ